MTILASSNGESLGIIRDDGVIVSMEGSILGAWTQEGIVDATGGMLAEGKKKNEWDTEFFDKEGKNVGIFFSGIHKFLDKDFFKKLQTKN